MALRTLSPLEARVLAVLVEKQHTVPDSYPLSLNALTLGCNQKTARDPVMNVSEADVLQAIEGLKEQSLVNEVSGSRVVRFEHNAPRGLGLPTQSVALLTLLMLRGPQTAAELRLHTERLHRFADISSVEGFLDEMAEREPRRVVRLPRAPGAREARWAHLLCGEVDVPAVTPGAAAPAEPNGASADEIAALKREQARMATELQQLRALVLRLAGELGVPTDEPPAS
ncbi:YceH family protein [Aquabacterium sp. A7-Y]|uniref:YceH family protein n=1 Tax=Aquabacterium sp. A7-Y TaxID=1349605 RepID=UPI00223D50CB|nr:YceH family protein [Aquabacterium sp. A7-Y]MCW7542126.1 YceH family protein [Aquabacterium sp. A7-Y]